MKEKESLEAIYAHYSEIIDRLQRQEQSIFNDVLHEVPEIDRLFSSGEKLNQEDKVPATPDQLIKCSSLQNTDSPSEISHEGFRVAKCSPNPSQGNSLEGVAKKTHKGQTLEALESLTTKKKKRKRANKQIPDISKSNNFVPADGLDIITTLEKLKESQMELEGPQTNDVKKLIIAFHRFCLGDFGQEDVIKSVAERVLEKKNKKSLLEGVINQVKKQLNELTRKKEVDKENYEYSTQAGLTRFCENLRTSDELLSEVFEVLRLYFVIDGYQSWIEFEQRKEKEREENACSRGKKVKEKNKFSTHLFKARRYFIARFANPASYSSYCHSKSEMKACIDRDIELAYQKLRTYIN